MSALGYPQVESTAKIKPFSEELRARLEAYQFEHRLTHKELAKQLDSNDTQISRYLSGKPLGNVEKLEAIAADVLKNSERLKAQKIELFETSVSRAVASAIDTIRKTNDLGLITGNAGIGKTCGITKYILQNPSSVLITASAWSRNASDVAKALWHAVDTNKYNGGLRKSDFLVERLRASNRPLIVDNAHRLKRGGIEFLFDFYDATNIPICLVGNPEILISLRKNDQQFSRVGLHRTVTDYKKNEPATIATTIISQAAPAFADCADLATKIVENRGHARALRKQLSLADELATKESFRADYPDDTNRHAMRVAHSNLIRDYAL